MMLLVLLVTMASLVVYVGMLTPKGYFDSSFADAERSGEAEHLEKARHALLVLDSISMEARNMGDQLWMSGMTVNDVLEKIQDMKTKVEETKLDLEKTVVPSKFSDSHAHLILAAQRMAQSLDSLGDAFSEFEKLDSKPPLYYVLSLLGSNDSNFYPLSQMMLLNETEKMFVSNAKTSFANLMIEADDMINERELFLSTAGLDMNSTSSQSTAFYDTYRSMPGSCASCKAPISEINKQNGP